MKTLYNIMGYTFNNNNNNNNNNDKVYVLSFIKFYAE